MRKAPGGFHQWVRASNKQMGEYEEAKNKDYTRNFSGKRDAIKTDFKRQNYFLLGQESFQTKQSADFGDEQVEQIRSKIEKISESKPLSNLIAAIGGQAFQAPLSVLEFLHFKHENEPIALIAKFDLSLYFRFNKELRYINLNFSYGFKNHSSNKNFILNQENKLIEITDQECQYLSTAVNALSNDLQTHLGLSIHLLGNNVKAKSSAEKAAFNITQAFQVSEKIHLESLITKIEYEIRLLIHEYILSRRESIIWAPGSNEEVASLDKLRRIRLKPIQGGGDHLEFYKAWSHLQVIYPSGDFEVAKNQWLHAHQLNDILIIRSPIHSKWQMYKINQSKELELWEGVNSKLLEEVLSEVTPQNVAEYDYTIVRDLLELNTRAVRQIDLVLGNNSEAIENHYVREEHPLMRILNLKKSMKSEDREHCIRKNFYCLLKEELVTSAYIRDFISMKSLKRALKFLILLFQNESLLKGLTDGEFIQWVSSSILIFFENLKKLHQSQNIRNQEFFKAQFLPKIEQARQRILLKRRKWLSKILNMDLNSEEIARFSRALIREASKVFMSQKNCYTNLFEAFDALYAKAFFTAMDNIAEIDELIYRLAYMKRQDTINADFLEILLCEAIHTKIRQERSWTPRIAEIFRMKAPPYFERSQQILEEVEQSIENRIQIQNEEREKALAACEEIKQKAYELSRFEVGSEHHVAGGVMHKIADDLKVVVSDYYKSHRTFVNHDAGASCDQGRLISKLNNAIDLRISQEDSLKKFEGLGQKIKTQVLNFFLVIFTLGIFPLTRKFILKKPAFFGSVKNEIAEEARVILCHH